MQSNKSIALVVVSVLFVVFLLYFLLSLIGTKSIVGSVESIADDYVEVNCSDEVNRGKRNVEDIAYLCEVQMTTNTTFETNDGQALTKNDFVVGDRVKVMLESRQKLKTNVESRKVKAKKIILMDE